LGFEDIGVSTILFEEAALTGAFNIYADYLFENITKSSPESGAKIGREADDFLRFQIESEAGKLKSFEVVIHLFLLGVALVP